MFKSYKVLLSVLLLILLPASALASVDITIDISEQRMYVYGNHGNIIGSSPVSTGKPGHRTPTGTFTILEKKVWHRSTKYSNAPMPYMQKLTSYGIAMHGGHLPGYPASHGCIRMPKSKARWLYNQTEIGDTVRIVP